MEVGVHLLRIRLKWNLSLVSCANTPLNMKQSCTYPQSNSIVFLYTNTVQLVQISGTFESCFLCNINTLRLLRGSTIPVMPRISKQFFLRNHGLLQQKCLSLLRYHSPDPRENKQIVSEYTHVISKYILRYCTLFTNLDSWKSRFDSAAVICQGHSSYPQLF